MKRFTRRYLLAVLLALIAVPVSAKELTVSAAVSLKEAFQDIAKLYQQQFPGVTVKLNTAGSGALVQQLRQGAPVDVLATADSSSMDLAMRHHDINPLSRRTFARNDLVLVLPQNSRQPLRALADLQQPAIRRIAIGQPDGVPAGRYAKAALEQAGLFAALRPKLIYTQNVRQSLDYVARGEVDAGFVYRTDAVLMAGKVRIAYTVPLEQPVSYQIATAFNSTDPMEAQRFVNFVASPSGRQILNRYGFR